MSTEHKPAKFIVTDPNPVTEDGGYIEALDAAQAEKIARELAHKHPTEYIDIYEHRVAFRVRPADSNDGEPA